MYIKLKLNLPQVKSSIINYNIIDGKIIGLDDDRLYDFIINIDGDLIIGKNHTKLSNKSKYVLFAGEIKLKDGKIYYINNNSGHYQPNLLETMKFILYFKTYNILSKNLIVEYFNNFIK